MTAPIRIASGERRVGHAAVQRDQMGGFSVLAWHFLADDRRMANEGEIVEPGYVYSAVGPLKLCESGMHASVKAIDAISFAPGPIVCHVRCSGEIVHGDDKLVCRNREVLWMADAASTLRLIACEIVRKTPLADGRTVWDLLTDARSRNAVEVAERYAHGKATDQELAAAWDAARAAAGAAGWDAARAAGWAAAGAAAGATGWDAAGDAARAAAGDAAWAAGWDAAWDPAWAAAWAAAGAAARKRQNEIATSLLMKLKPKGGQP